MSENQKEVLKSGIYLIKDDLIEPFYIEKDNYCFTVIEKTKPTRGFAGGEKVNEESKKTIGHYSTLSNAINKIINLKITSEFGCGVVSLKQYIESYQRVENNINQFLNTIKT